MNFTPYVIFWFVLGIATAVLALYRKWISLKEEDYIHLGPGQDELISKQSALARRMDVVDRWGETLTVVTIVFGLILAGVYLYQAWAMSLVR